MARKRDLLLTPASSSHASSSCADPERFEVLISMQDREHVEVCVRRRRAGGGTHVCERGGVRVLQATGLLVCELE